MNTPPDGAWSALDLDPGPPDPRPEVREVADILRAMRAESRRADIVAAILALAALAVAILVRS